MKTAEVVGYRIREARKSLTMSQAQLGEALGDWLGKAWFPQAVSEAEKGRRAFTAEEILVIAHVLARPVAWFFIPPLYTVSGDAHVQDFDLPSGEVLSAGELSETALAGGERGVLEAIVVEALDNAEAERHAANMAGHRWKALAAIANQLAHADEKDEEEAQ
jgi:transcriptional regulator with XRE-family HTH domain